MKKPLIPLLLVAAAAAAWFFWPSSSAEEGSLRLSGNVDIRSVDLAFRVGGRLAAVSVDEGATVAPGALLASLDPEPFELALRQAEANAESARLAIPVAERMAASLEATLNLRRAGYRAEEIDAARAQLASAQAILAHAGRELEREEALVKKSAVSQSAYDEAKKTRDSQLALVDAAAARVAELEAGYRPEEIAQAEAQHAAALAGVEDLRAKLAAAEAAREQAALALRDTELHAPAAGIVLARVREPGSMVAAGAPVLTLSLRQPVWVRAYVDEGLLDRVSVGQSVSVCTDGGGRYAGRVAFVSPQAEFTPKTVETADIRTTLVYRLRIVVEGEGAEKLNQGAPVTVEIPR